MKYEDGSRCFHCLMETYSKSLDFVNPSIQSDVQTCNKESFDV